MARSRLRRWRLAALVAGIVLVVSAAALTLWVVHLDRIVTREFQGRHWSVPARVYAAPLELYVDAPLSADDLEEELHRLHYRRGDPATGPGIYRRTGPAFDLHARRVRFTDELREPEGSPSGRAPNPSPACDWRTIPTCPSSASIRPVVGSVFPIHGEDRLVVEPADVPPLLRAGIKRIEDRRFDEHHGVDVYGVLRASWANLRAGRVVQGGSTLTQQLVKNYFLSDEQTAGRKLTEAIMALRLEAHFSKEEILVAYLNEVYLGQDGARAIHGFGLGSEYYFAKPLDELDAGELALLIGLVKGPSYYDPRRHEDRGAHAPQSRPAGIRRRPSARCRRGQTRRREAAGFCGRRAAAMSRPTSTWCGAFEARLCRSGPRRRRAVRVHQSRPARPDRGGARAGRRTWPGSTPQVPRVPPISRARWWWPSRTAAT